MPAMPRKDFYDRLKQMKAEFKDAKIYLNGRCAKAPQHSHLNAPLVKKLCGQLLISEASLR